MKFKDSPYASTGMQRQEEVRQALCNKGFFCEDLRAQTESIAKLADVNVNLLEKKMGDLVLRPAGVPDLGLTIEVCSSEKYLNGSVGVDKERLCQADLIAFNLPSTEHDGRYIALFFRDDLWKVLGCISAKNGDFKIVDRNFINRYGIPTDELLEKLKYRTLTMMRVLI